MIPSSNSWDNTHGVQGGRIYAGAIQYAVHHICKQGPDSAKPAAYKFGGAFACVEVGAEEFLLRCCGQFGESFGGGICQGSAEAYKLLEAGVRIYENTGLCLVPVVREGTIQ